MDLLSHIRPGYIRTVALALWTGAIALTAVLGMSAWVTFQDVQPGRSDPADPAAAYLAKYTETEIAVSRPLGK